MKRMWLGWIRKYRLYLLAGALLWVAIAGVSWNYAKTTGQPYLQTMVTWDEWAVAVLYLPWLGKFLSLGLSTMTRGSRVNMAMQNVMYGASTQSVTHQIEEDLTEDAPTAGRTRLGSRLGAVGTVTFALDLLVRGVFGLGWQPFL